jgi:excinuclease ABC subunit A
MEHNLKNINVKFPLKAFTVVTGVSGSGKSSLVGDVLYPALCRHFEIVGPLPGAYRDLTGDLKKLEGVEYIDQNPLGKSARSNPVTYLKIYDDIRKIFSEQPYAKMNGYGHSHFSFNIDGGRCPVCLGDGFITIPMQFMADVRMVCEECGGKRFKPDILEVKYHDKNINDVLNLSVDQAIEFFGVQKESVAQRVAEKLKVLQDVGLGYIQLGQSSSTLSGGESQRVMLAKFLSKDTASGLPGAGGKLFIFDEPTTGLHFNDIGKLLQAFDALVDAGNTIIVVEHNTDVIKAADWIIDLGPDSGDKGGEVVFTGTPEQLKDEPRWKEYLN